MIAPADLRISPVFADLGEDELAWLASIATELTLAPGQAVALEGDPADAMYLILSGQVQLREERTAETRIALFEPGELTGMLPFSRMTSYPGTLRAVEATRAVRIGIDRFPEMLQRLPKVEQRLVAALADRVREATRAEEQREKLMALGKLSAGLAHEMNNPAAALRRGAAHLRDRLRAMPGLTVSLAGCNLNLGQFATLAALHARATAPGDRERLSPLRTSEREEAVGEWLEDRGVAGAWELAETFVSAGMQVDDLDSLAGALPERSLADAMAWLGSGLAADRLLRELEEASRRISELVASVKGYSHMDEAAVRAAADVHAGLESTLVMLGHKVRERNAVVERDFDPSLPHPVAHAGSLNQVWTNLIDNALDAIAPGGRIRLRTWHRDDVVVVEVHDDGPGVPPEIQARIWEPFFTTKDVGEGTGLGLDVARRIVVRQHGGDLSLVSRPGDTCFQVRLPVHPPGARGEREADREDALAALDVADSEAEDGGSG